MPSLQIDPPSLDTKVQAPAKSTMRGYRPDIDGLRAVAVILVVGFHVGAPQLRGGFIGVDVFFVISGYLITGIIAKQIAERRFTIAGFYERRARRILPALFAVLAATTVVALWYLLPGELVSYGKSMLGAVFSYSNFYFWSTADYFDDAAQMKPLLHTWSLGVEEQFYVLLPILLLILAKWFPKARKPAVVSVAAVSFMLSVWMSRETPVAAFYLPISRAWELLSGSILALEIVPAINLRWRREAAAFAGIALILYAAANLRSDTPFPGFAALLPCVGSALLIAAGSNGTTLVGSVLSLKPLTFVGLISYSVYLWHWPLIVFTQMGFLPWLPRDNRSYALSILVISLLLGPLSWWFIERPFRVGSLRARVRVGACTSALLVIAVAAAFFIRTGGVPSRFPASAIQIGEQMEKPVHVRQGLCFIDGKSHLDDFRVDTCMRLDPAKKNYLLLGDSHSAALWYGLSHEMTTSNILQATVAGCKPNIHAGKGKDCDRMLDYVFDDFLPRHRVDAVFISARWHRTSDFENLQSTIEWCKQHKVPVVVFGPVMEYDAPLPKVLAFSLAFHDPGLVQRHMRSEMFSWDKAMQQKAQRDWQVPYISMMDAQCPNELCLTFADADRKTVLMKDDNHLSDAGSAFMVRRLLAAGQLPPQPTKASGPSRAK